LKTGLALFFQNIRAHACGAACGVRL